VTLLETNVHSKHQAATGLNAENVSKNRAELLMNKQTVLHRKTETLTWLAKMWINRQAAARAEC
jgi:hypothetical protein